MYIYNRYIYILSIHCIPCSYSQCSYGVLQLATIFWKSMLAEHLLFSLWHPKHNAHRHVFDSAASAVHTHPKMPSHFSEFLNCINVPKTVATSWSLSLFPIPNHNCIFHWKTSCEYIHGIDTTYIYISFSVSNQFDWLLPPAYSRSHQTKAPSRRECSRCAIQLHDDWAHWRQRSLWKTKTYRGEEVKTGLDKWAWQRTVALEYVR